MTKKKTRKRKNLQNSQEIKQQDRNNRHKKAKINSQLDNALYAFMYAIESKELEVMRSARESISDHLFNPEIIEQIEDTIMSNAKTLEELISGSRKLAEYIIKQRIADKKNLILKEDVELAISMCQEEKLWPYSLKVKEIEP